MDKKRLLTLMPIFFLYMCMAAWTIAGQERKGAENKATSTQGTDQKMDEESFLNKYLDAFKANDKIRMEAPVKQAGSDVVYQAVISQAKNGIFSVAEGKNGSVYFNTAEAMAAAGPSPEKYSHDQRATFGSGGLATDFAP